MKKILWAIDEFTEDHARHSRAARVLCTLTSAFPAVIELVHVYSPERGLAGAAFEDPCDPGALHAREALHSWLRKVRLPGLTEPRILVQEGLTRRSKVRTFLEYGAFANVELVVVGGHGASRVGRALHGDFAEAMALRSDLPVLVVTEHTLFVDHYDCIFYAGDPHSHAAFDEIAGIAREAKLPLVLVDSPEAVLTKAAGKHAPIVAFPAGHSFLGSPRRRILHDAACPVMVVHRNAA